MVTCNEPTENYSNGRALLLAWDANKDKTISKEDVDVAVKALIDCRTDYLCPVPISDREIAFIHRCYDDYNGDINKMCPSPIPTTFYMFLFVVGVITLYLLGGKK